MVREILATLRFRWPAGIDQPHVLAEGERDLDRRLRPVLAKLASPVLLLERLGGGPLALDVGPDVACVHDDSLSELRRRRRRRSGVRTRTASLPFDDSDADLRNLMSNMD